MSIETNEHLEYTEYEPDMPIPEIEYQNETSENYNDNYEMSNEILVKQEQKYFAIILDYSGFLFGMP